MSELPEASEGGVEIPVELLSPDALTSLIESIVLREGTDYGEVELAFEEKVARLRAALANDEARIVFDPESESVTVVQNRKV